jgi:hypothetical protein
MGGIEACHMNKLANDLYGYVVMIFSYSSCTIKFLDCHAIQAICCNFALKANDTAYGHALQSTFTTQLQITAKK